MKLSTSAGVPRTRLRSGSVTSFTTRSLQATRPSVRPPQSARRKLRIVRPPTGKAKTAPPPGGTSVEEEAAPALEARRQTDRESPRVRERERVDRVDRGRLRLSAGDADFRIEAAIAGDRPEVAPDETDLPISLASNRAETVRDEELANLGIARILDREIVGAENVVEATE